MQPVRPASLSAITCALVTCASVLGACAEPASEGRYPEPAAELRIVASHPRQGEVMDDARVTVDLCFSHRLDPSSISDEDLRLRSGSIFYDAELEVELSNWRERGGEEITDQPWCEGSVLRLQTGGAIVPGISYRVLLHDGLRAWTGERLDTEAEGWVLPTAPDTDGEVDDPRDLEPRWVLDFSIAPDALVPEDDEEEEPTQPRSLESLFDPLAVFDPELGLCSCHTLDAKASELLDLRGPGVAYTALVGDLRLRSSGYPMVTPGDPAASFLVQKLVHHEGGTLPGVLGDPMPLGSEGLPSARLGEISAWILDGAQP